MSYSPFIRQQPDEHYLGGSMLCHRVQRTAVLKPLNLLLIISMIQLDIKALAILRMHFQCHWLADRQLCAQQIHLIIWVDLVVVSRISKSKWKHALLLQICLVLENVSVDQIL